MKVDFLHTVYSGFRVVINPCFQCEVEDFLSSSQFLDMIHLLPEGTILACGGDGTFLEAMHTYPGSKVLGINFGTRGYLLFPREGVIGAECFSEKKFPLLEGFCAGNPYTNTVNELVIKGTGGHLIELDCFFGDEHISLRADGCLVSTSLGSTGYNASLGGPILLDSDHMIVTPIAPLSPRMMNPLVLRADTVIRFRPIDRRDTEIGVYQDGREIYRGSSQTLGELTLSVSSVSGTYLLPENGTSSRRLQHFFSFL